MKLNKFSQKIANYLRYYTKNSTVKANGISDYDICSFIQGVLKTFIEQAFVYFIICLVFFSPLLYWGTVAYTGVMIAGSLPFIYAAGLMVSIGLAGFLALGVLIFICLWGKEGIEQKMESTVTGQLIKAKLNKFCVKMEWDDERN